MEDFDSIGLVELSSVARGYTVEDAMIKAANVKIIMARTICSGKFLVAVAGDSDAVSASLESATRAGRGAIIEKRHITRVHNSIFPAIMGNVALDPDKADALGIIETFSASSIIDVADAAVKSANVTLFRVHLAMALGGKGVISTVANVAPKQTAQL